MHIILEINIVLKFSVNDVKCFSSEKETAILTTVIAAHMHAHTHPSIYPGAGVWLASRSWMMFSRVVILSLLAARLASTLSSRCCMVADLLH